MYFNLHNFFMVRLTCHLMDIECLNTQKHNLKPSTHVTKIGDIYSAFASYLHNYTLLSQPNGTKKRAQKVTYSPFALACMTKPRYYLRLKSAFSVSITLKYSGHNQNILRIYKSIQVTFRKSKNDLSPNI